MSNEPTRDHDDATQLAQSLTHELFELGSTIDLVGNATASRLGINQTDLICLNLIARRGPMGAGQIASALGLSTAAISAMATRLEAGGYAQREIDPTDRRRVLLHASQAGAQQAFALFDRLYMASVELASSYDAQTLHQMITILNEFRGLLVEHAETIHAPSITREESPH